MGARGRPSAASFDRWRLPASASRFAAWGRRTWRRSVLGSRRAASPTCAPRRETSAIRRSSGRPSADPMRFGEAARSSASSRSTDTIGLSVCGSPPNTAAGAMDQRPSGRSWHTQSSIVSSAAPVALRIDVACRRIIEGNGFTEEKRVVIATPSAPCRGSHSITLVFLKSASGDIAMICAVSGAPISLQRTPRLRPCRDIARHAPRTRFA